MSELSTTDIKLAAKAHETVMINLACFHLVLPVAAFTTGYIKPLILCSIIGAALMLISLYIAKQRDYSDWVKGHWQGAWLRSRLLIVAYTISGLILLVAHLIGMLQTDAKMATILLVVFMRIAAVPILLCVLMLFVLETSALSQAKQAMPIAGPFTS